MDWLFNSQPQDLICKGKRDVGYIKSDRILLSNYANTQDEPLLSHSRAISKAAADYKPPQTPQNPEPTSEFRFINQMASHLLGN